MTELVLSDDIGEGERTLDERAKDLQKFVRTTYDTLLTMLSTGAVTLSPEFELTSLGQKFDLANLRKLVAGAKALPTQKKLADGSEISALRDEKSVVVRCERLPQGGSANEREVLSLRYGAEVAAGNLQEEIMISHTPTLDSDATTALLTITTPSVGRRNSSYSLKVSFDTGDTRTEGTLTTDGITLPKIQATATPKLHRVIEGSFTAPQITK